MTVPSEIQALVHKDAIRAVLYRTCRAMDRADYELFKSCYHADAWDDHGYFKGPVAEFKPSSIFRGPHVRNLQHNLTNILIELEGDVAWSEAYYLAYQRAESDGKLRDTTFGGRYYDRFERRSGEWRIAHRVTIFEWTRVDDVGDTLSIAGAVVGHASREDPTYQRLAVRG